MNRLTKILTVIGLLITMSAAAQTQSRQEIAEAMRETTWKRQTVEESHPIIVPFEVPLRRINQQLKDIGHRPVYEVNGYVIIPPTMYKQTRGGSCGIMIAFTDYEHFVAADLRCPNCYRNYGKTITMKLGIHGGKYTPTCPECSAQVMAFVFSGSRTLNAYDFGMDDPEHLDGYMVEVKKNDKGETILRISNPTFLTPVVNPNRNKPQYQYEPTLEDYFGGMK